MKDILLEINNGIYDIGIENGDFKSTEGLDTSILMSLFVDNRADESEVSTPELRRGWLGNEMNDDTDYEIGSKLWLLDQSRLTTNTLNNAISYCDQSLEWLLTDNLAKDVNVTGVINQPTGIKININFVRSDNNIESKQYDLWENTSIA